MNGSYSVTMSEYREWERFGLSDNPTEFAEFINQEDDYGDSMRGEWYYAPDELVTVDGESLRVIYYGTFGNYHSPGACHYTYAELYADGDDYEGDIAQLRAAPEFIETADAE